MVVTAKSKKVGVAISWAMVGVGDVLGYKIVAVGGIKVKLICGYYWGCSLQIKLGCSCGWVF